MWNDAIPDRSAQQVIKRKEILRAAAQAFARQGSHGATLESVASSLGVSKAALYRYVPGKNDLILACQEAALDIADHALTRAEASEANGLEIIRIGLQNYLIEMMEEMGVPAIILENDAIQGKDAPRILNKRDAYEQRLRALVAKGQADGSIVVVDAKLAVFMLLGAIHWVSKWYRPGEEWSPEEVAQSMAALAARALEVAPAPELITKITPRRR